jgi:probable HAF family extracellular repeat protein
MRRSAPVTLLAPLALAAGCHDPRPAATESAPAFAVSGDGRVAYDVVTLDQPAGATQGRGMGISNRGWVAGWTAYADLTRRATLWRGNVPENLGTLAGPGGVGASSMVPWPGINNSGMVVGISHTADVDPLNEGWSCEQGAFLPSTAPRRVCRGFVWTADGGMRALPTFGGTHGFATGVNNRGQVVGWAETPLRDPTCTGVQQLQFRAGIWEPRRGTARQLAPLPGDSTSAATAINESGVAVGISGDCDQAVGRYSARHAVLWERDGTPTRIPDLGGTSWHTPMDVNERGDVAGFSNPPSEADSRGDFSARAFFWARGARRAVDVGVLPGNTSSQALGVNERREVVGVSSGGTGGTRAFVWRDSVLYDLTELAGVAPDVLVSAQHVNDVGQITGRLRRAATNEVVPFVATPRRRR